MIKTQTKGLKSMHVSDFASGVSLMKAWKKCRSSLTKDLSDVEHLQNLIDFWSNCPISARLLDWDQPETWPDAWTLVYNNNFDESAISLGMFYTLLLANDNRWTAERLQLILTKDINRQFQGIVLKVDNRWLLNLEYNRLVQSSIEDMEYTVQQRYFYKDNKHHLFKTRNISNQNKIKTNNNAIS
jgi:hypothetical protein